MNLNKVLIIISILFTLCSAVTGMAQDGRRLIDSIMYQEFDKAKTLIDNGVDVNYQEPQHGSSPLLLACQYGFVDMAKYLIEHGADINIQAKNGYTPLIAAAGTSEDLTHLLLSKNANIHLKLENGTTAFTTSIVGILASRVSLRVPEKLIKKGANVNESAIKGKTAGYTCMMMAARNKRPDLVKFLFLYGADVNAKAKDGSTPLSLAIKEKDEEMIKLLKIYGAKE